MGTTKNHRDWQLPELFNKGTLEPEATSELL